MKFNKFPTYVSFTNKHTYSLPEKYGFQDVRYTKDFARYFINRFSEQGDTVLDPFAGFGTTLVVANEMDRKAFGIEIDEKKIAYMRDVLGLDEGLIHGDVNRLFLEKKLPKIDLILTSPPYMGREDNANALTGYRYAGKYDEYLEDLKGIMVKLSKIMTQDGLILLEISNLVQKNSRTTLAWDVAVKLSEILRFQGEIIINWTGEREVHDNGFYNYGYDHSYCLIFSVNEL